MRVETAEAVGYCYGVERAMRMTDKAIRQGEGPVYTLGPIIHNPQVVTAFESRGLSTVDGLAGLDSGTVIVRTHGVGPELMAEAAERGLRVVDATCPFVAKAQERAAELEAGGYRVIIVGEPSHPEVVGIIAHAAGAAQAVEGREDLPGIDISGRVGVVVQTTQSPNKVGEIVGVIVESCSELVFHNTVCRATVRRQKAARELAEEVDIMIVVGGKNSANTNRLVDICSSTGTPSFHVETADELRSSWVAEVEAVGVTTGASTPDSLLDQVVASLKRMGS